MTKKMNIRNIELLNIFNKGKKKYMFSNFMDWFCIKWMQKKGKFFNKKKLNQKVIFAHDFIGYNIELFGLYEKEYLEYFKNHFTHLLRDKKKFVDVGANIGNHSLFFYDLFDSIICIEASPRNFSLLKLNCSSPKFELINCAASSSMSKLPFLHFPHNMGGSKVVSGNDLHEEGVEYIQAEKLDVLIKENESIDLIKLDVEGHELDVLKGAENIISKFQPIIIFEQNSWEVANNQESAADFLKGMGYFFHILQSNDPHEPNIKFIKIKRILDIIFRGIKVKSFVTSEVRKDCTYPFIVAIPKY